MKRRMRPVDDAADEPMLYRIDITVLDVSGIIVLVTNQMLPKPTLPDAALLVRNTGGAEVLRLRKRA